MNLRGASRTLVRTAWQAVPTVIGARLGNTLLLMLTALAIVLF